MFECGARMSARHPDQHIGINQDRSILAARAFEVITGSAQPACIRGDIGGIFDVPSAECRKLGYRLVSSQGRPMLPGGEADT